VVSDLATALKEFKVTKKYFVGIDSDGCVFDTMGIKQGGKQAQDAEEIIGGFAAKASAG
jgi:hypothetical protein